MIRAVIIEDNPSMIEVNTRLLAEHFPAIELQGTANSVKTSIELIKTTNPDLVLLDIELTDGTGFQLLKHLHPYTFKTVFITAFDSFAIKAIKFSACDYILKPVNETEFQKAIQEAVNLIVNSQNTSLQTNILLNAVKHKKQKKLVLKTQNAIHIVNISDIFFCKSDNSYTTFYFEEKEKILVSKSLKDYENLLVEYGFFRSHQSYLVNINHIKKLDKTDGGFIMMKNNQEIPVSQRQMKRLIETLETL